MPTVRKELRDKADADLRDAIAANPDNMQLASIGRLLEERDRLRSTLSDPEFHFGEAPEEPRALGTETERVPGEAEPGELFVSYAERPSKVPGRPQLGGRSKGIVGIPRQSITGKQFTGESIRQGRITKPKEVIRGVARGELQAVNRRRVLALRDAVVKESISAEELEALRHTSPNVAKHYDPVRIKGQPFSADTRRYLDKLEAKENEGRNLSFREQEKVTAIVEQAREFFFPAGRHATTTRRPPQPSGARFASSTGASSAI